MSADGLRAAARQVLAQALRSYRDRPATARLLHRQLQRLDEPLRVALAGKVKAGKSTLLNALVGEQVAPTDAAECTRVVTWYRDGPSPSIVLHPHRGGPVRLPVGRQHGSLVIDLGSRRAEEVERLVVGWPSHGLRTTTLIDTPGIASAHAATSRRTVDLIDPDDEAPTEVDAVVYLMRHLHTTDVTFLEAFRDQGVPRTAAVNAVAVISRADEVGAGRVDAMVSARAIARRYATEPVVRGLCQDVVAVAGLLAQAGRTLRQDEFASVKVLGGVPRAESDAALLSVDRFLRADGAVAAAAGSVEWREWLLRRFGLFGLRLAVMLVRNGTGSAPALAAELVDRSGLRELQQVLLQRFSARSDLLKARSALLGLDRVLRSDPQRPAALAGQVERILAGAHEFVELRTVSALRSGAIVLPAGCAEEAERVLGAAGDAPHLRLGLPADAGIGALLAAATATMDGWHRRAVNPMHSRSVTETCLVVVRSCEGLLAALAR